MKALCTGLNYNSSISNLRGLRYMKNFRFIIIVMNLFSMEEIYLYIVYIKECTMEYHKNI